MDYAPEETTYKGLAVQFMTSNPKNPSVVIAKGLGIPGKEFEWMFLLNQVGFNVTYAPYRGTWLSKGEFLSKNNNSSIVNDVSDLVRFSKERFGSEKIYLVGECFGASPALVTSSYFYEIKKVISVGGVIYTSNSKLIKKYLGDKRDKTLKVGMTLKKSMNQRGTWFNGYKGFDFDVWINMMYGKTELNPYRIIDKLEKKELLLMHATNDNMVTYERTIDFFKAIQNHLQNKQSSQNIQLKIMGNGGHRTSFGNEEKLYMLGFLTDKPCEDIIPTLKTGLEIVNNHSKIISRPEGESLRVPFYDLVVKQIEKFKKAGLLNNNPLELILNQIF
ncbi:MAG: prolyl oligopeptidase family serine peptidase [Nanoarchaeota archaeon]|nr:prolyl oligopeptidase family serine peptidase [Nanoarchaeota archaeon]